MGEFNIMSVREMIDRTFGDPKENTVDFNLLKAIMYILASQLRILQRHVALEETRRRKALGLTMSVTELKIHTKRKKGKKGSDYEDSFDDLKPESKRSNISVEQKSLKGRKSLDDRGGKTSTGKPPTSKFTTEDQKTIYDLDKDQKLKTSKASSGGKTTSRYTDDDEESKTAKEIPGEKKMRGKSPTAKSIPDKSTTTDTNLASKPTTEKASTYKSPTDKSATDKSTADKSTLDKTELSSRDKSTADKYATDKSTANKYATDESSADKYATDKSTSDKYATDKSTADKYATDKSTADKYTSDKSTGKSADKKIPSKAVADGHSSFDDLTKDQKSKTPKKSAGDKTSTEKTTTSKFGTEDERRLDDINEDEESKTIDKSPGELTSSGKSPTSKFATEDEERLNDHNKDQESKTSSKSQGGKTLSGKSPVSKFTTEDKEHLDDLNKDREIDNTGKSPTDKTSSGKSATAKSSPDKSTTTGTTSTDKSSSTKSTTEKSSTYKSSSEKSATNDQSSSTKSTTEKSSTPKSTTEKTSSSKSKTEKTSTSKSTTEKTSTSKSTSDKYSTPKSSTDKSTEKSTKQKSSSSKSSKQKSSDDDITSKSKKKTSEKSSSGSGSTGKKGGGGVGKGKKDKKAKKKAYDYDDDEDEDDDEDDDDDDSTMASDGTLPTQEQYRELAKQIRKLQVVFGQSDKFGLLDSLHKTTSMTDPMAAINMATRLDVAEKQLADMMDAVTKAAGEISGIDLEAFDDTILKQAALDDWDAPGLSSQHPQDGQNLAAFKQPPKTRDKKVKKGDSGFEFEYDSDQGSESEAGPLVQIPSDSNIDYASRIEFRRITREIRDTLIKKADDKLKQSVLISDDTYKKFKALDQQIDAAMDIGDAFSLLECDVDDYADKINTLDGYISTQLTLYQDTLTQMQFDLETGIDGMTEALSRPNEDADAVHAELNVYFNSFTLDLGHMLHRQQELKNQHSSFALDLEALSKKIEMLRKNKSTRDELNDALSDKVGVAELNGIVAMNQFEAVQGDFEKQIRHAYDLINNKEFVWQRAIDDLIRSFNEKADINGLSSLQNEIHKYLEVMKYDLDEMLAIVGDVRTNPNKKKIDRDGKCISCGTNVNIEVNANVMEWYISQTTLAAPEPIDSTKAIKEDSSICIPGRPIKHPIDPRSLICRNFCGAESSVPCKLNSFLIAEWKQSQPNAEMANKKMQRPEYLKPCKPCNSPKYSP